MAEHSAPLHPIFAVWRWKLRYLCVFLLLILILIFTYFLTTPIVYYVTSYDFPRLHQILELTYYAPANWFFENSRIYHDFWIWEAKSVYESA